MPFIIGIIIGIIPFMPPIIIGFIGVIIGFIIGMLPFIIGIEFIIGMDMVRSLGVPAFLVWGRASAERFGAA
jgi:hypothetical protein